ncbi:hypothetical protein MLIT_42360 [Mycolicibacterium litorale]|uniref:HTH lysR-type domain-containing protein n=1 Tax=Mycolicibacterium litorale TaxID=758802 RepID=A0AAD1MTQ5_9MYCO|nr:regulatory helix-turn-helix LysR family protein [Mycolicibacterium litorale]BBY18644.1 hypothetical protein MLIT_42360 [Mycolicibacterium litorale]
MEPRQLEYFTAVADDMSFTRAAQRVHVVQSALSTSIKKLEDELPFSCSTGPASRSD